METKNLVQNDELVAAIFEAVRSRRGDPYDKLVAVIRAGRIAEAFTDGHSIKIIEATLA